MKLQPIALTHIILGGAAVVLGFYVFLKPAPPNFFLPIDYRMMVDNGLWGLTFFGFPLIALGITLLSLDEGESFFASILAAMGSLSLSIAVHQVLFLGAIDVSALITLGVFLFAISIFVHFKTRNLSVKT
jgi:hypothetical protein